MSRRRDPDPWQSSAASMRGDPAGRRLYGPLWPLLADVWALAPHTNLNGIATLVALCAERGDVDDLCTRLHRPHPVTRESPHHWMAGWLPTCRPVGDLVVDSDIVAWVGDDPSRRLWAIVALVWGLNGDGITGAYCTLTAIAARPARLPLAPVAELAAANPERIPALLMRDRPLDVVADSYARALGVGADAGIDLTLPAALGITAASLAADALEGIAAAALLIRTRGHPDVTPDTLAAMCRRDSAAGRLASILARLWAHSLHDEPSSVVQAAPSA
jgi:hypothetical protein